MNEYISLLQENELFKEMSANQIVQVLQCGNPVIKAYKQKKVIVHSGEILDQIAIILEGEIDLFKEDFSGNRSLIGHLSGNDVFGQLAIFNDQGPSSLTILAATTCKILLLNRSLFFETCNKSCPCHQMMIKNMLTLLANQANLLDRKINYLTIRSLKGKIAKFLLDESQKNQGNLTFSINLNRDQMAEYFDVQRPSLSRELSSLKENGVIDYYRNTFKILDKNCLEELI